MTTRRDFSRRVCPRFRLLGAIGAAALAASMQTGAAAEEAQGALTPPPPTLPLPVPSWYTDELHEDVLAAGSNGVEVSLLPEQRLEPNCLGTSPPSATPASLDAVSAGGCMVYPHGCTMNYIFRDTSGASYIGTAGHCVDKGGDVVMQVAMRVDPSEMLIVTLAKIGRIAKRANSGVGRDFGLVKIDPGWPVVPGVAGAAGPSGVFCGDPIGQPVLHYGHGYIFFVEQGYPKVGEVILDLDPPFKFTSTQYGYNWIGYGLPGDSGSPVMDAALLAVGNLTHGLGVAGVPLPGLNFGMTMAGIFKLIGSSYSLVTVDGRAVRCTGLIGL